MSDDLGGPDPKLFMTVFVAALMFATSEDATDNTLNQSFDRAERFIAKAEERYGPITDA